MEKENSILLIVSIIGLVAIVSMLIVSGRHSFYGVNTNIGMAVGNVVSDTSNMAITSSNTAIASSTAEQSLNCQWTGWLNRDVPDGSGDWETRASFPNVCATPSAVECRTTNDLDWRTVNQNGYICSTQSGGICQNSLTNNNCLDYKVRFCCPTDTNVTPVIPPCTDNDSIVNIYDSATFYIKGTTTYNGQTFTDACESGLLREYHCVSNGTTTVIRGELETCPNGCFDGACVKDNVTSVNLCVDSDGTNYFSKGNVTFNGTTAIVDACSGSVNAVGVLNEAVCLNGFPSMDFHMCPNGCLDGACIQTTNVTPDHYVDACGNGNVDINEICDIGDLGYTVRPGLLTLSTISTSSLSATVTLNGQTYTIKFIARSPDNKVTLFSNGEYVLFSEGTTKTIGGLIVYVKKIYVFNGYTYVDLEPRVGHIFDCADLGLGYSGGTLTCNSNCNGYNYSQCKTVNDNDLTLANYPQPFMTSYGIFDALFIVGEKATADDVVGTTDMAASLQRYAGDNPLPVGIVKLDRDVSDNDLGNRNLIIVGGMCANTATERIYNMIYGFSSDCTSQDSPGIGHIKVIRNPYNNNKLVLLVHGYSAMDTTMATRVLANWQNYNTDFVSTNSLCVTGTLTNMQVTRC